VEPVELLPISHSLFTYIPNLNFRFSFKLSKK
jgi:hypothetical protein